MVCGAFILILAYLRKKGIYKGIGIKLSDKLRIYRSDRPDELTMDEFTKLA